MKYQIFVLQEAEDDLFDIYRYILENDSRDSAQYVRGELEEKINGLEELPSRGHYPPELERIGITGYLEIHFKPYRVIYEIEGKKIFIHAVIDGRRDIQSLLERRLFR